MQSDDRSPFGEEPVEHVPLAGAPLIKVVCQVRWPMITAFESSAEEILKHVGKAVAPRFPVTRRQKEVNYVIGPGGVSQQTGNEIFQYLSSDDNWTLALSSSFLALETTAYNSQDDFCERFRFVLETLQEVCQIPYVDRIGYRYVNRVAGRENVDQIHETINEAVRGGGAVPKGKDSEMIQTLTETVYKVRENKLLARWAVLPQGVTVDPSIPASDEPSWVLDLDSYREGRMSSSTAEVIAIMRDLSDTGYRFFRWAVNESFLRRFGGDV